VFKFTTDGEVLCAGGGGYMPMSGVKSTVQQSAHKLQQQSQHTQQQSQSVAMEVDDTTQYGECSVYVLECIVVCYVLYIMYAVC